MALRWRCERHTFWQWREVRYHGNGILWQKIRRKFVDRITSTFLKHFKWNFAHLLALRCTCARHTFWKWWKVCYHGNGILWQEIVGGKLCRAFLMEFGTHGNSAIPQTCTFGGDVYYALRNYWFTCFSENYNDLSKKKFTSLQNTVYTLSFDTRYKMYWPCMAEHEPFQMVMPILIWAE